MTEAECAAATTSDEWLQCTSYFLEPVMSTVATVGAIAVTLAIVMTGIIFARRVVQEFGKS